MQGFYIGVALLWLTGCGGMEYQQQYTASPPTVTEIQAQCFASFKKFMAQTECIANKVTTLGVAPSSYAQEYMAYMQSLQDKVRHKTLPDSDARIKLTNKLNEVRTLQNNEIAAQEQLHLQRATHNAEVLRQYQANQQRIREAYPTYVPVRSSPIVVNPAPQHHAPSSQQTYSPPNPQTTNCIMGRDRLQCVSSPQY